MTSSYQCSFTMEELAVPDASGASSPDTAPDMYLLLTRSPSSSSPFSSSSSSAPAASSSAPNPYSTKTYEAKVQDVNDAVGFSSIFEMMRDCGKPAVGHNLMFDLGFSLQQFVEPLPRNWDAYKELVSRWVLLDKSGVSAIHNMIVRPLVNAAYEPCLSWWVGAYGTGGSQLVCTTPSMWLASSALSSPRPTLARCRKARPQ